MGCGAKLALGIQLFRGKSGGSDMDITFVVYRDAVTQTKPENALRKARL